MKESGPWILKISELIANAAEPESERISDEGSASGGNPVQPITGRMAQTRKSMAPLARNMPMATRMATRYGMMRTPIVNPSLAPSIKLS